MKNKKPLAPEQFRFAVLATDVALFSIKDGELLVRMVSVRRPPHFPDNAALPGGLLESDETAEEAVRRIIVQKAEVDEKKVHIEQLATFSEVDRDPRGRVVSVAYIALVPWNELSVLEQADTQDAWWARARDTKNLAYDHNWMIKVAVARLASRITYTTLISKLVAREFTLTALESAYESILKTDLDKRNFRKKILKLNILKKVTGKKTSGAFRPAQLYTFASSTVREIEVL